MIEINAKLFRGSVYFNNEQLKCRISYKNVGDEVERLAWSGVQIYCHSALDETKVASTSKGNEISEDEVALSSKETSFHPCKGEKGRLVFSTKPKILFCDLTLHPNEIQTYLYEETIPPDCPPSYYGSWVKYMYKLSIGTQRVNSVIQLLRMPLRVISLAVDINNMPNGHHNNHHPTTTTTTTTPVKSSPSPSPSPPTATATATATTTPTTTTTSTNTTKTNENENVHQEDSIPLSSSASNNYVDYECKESTLDIVLHKLDCLTGKRSPSSFLITNQTGRIARFCLLKSTFKLGEDIVGFFDFTDSTVPCVQFSVTLQSEETLKEAFRLRSGKSTHISSHSRFHEFCLHMNNAQMILPIPLTVTPAFETNLMTLTWKLHVEFVSTKPTEIDTNKMIDNYGVMEQGPAEMKVQTMTWDLPIHVLPTHPLQIGRGLSMPATMSTNF